LTGQQYVIDSTYIKGAVRLPDLHLRLDFKRKFATLESQPLVLMSEEYQLFSLLVENTGTTVSRQVLITCVRG
jgi:DNA-binding response OmpR family regulator